MDIMRILKIKDIIEIKKKEVPSPIEEDIHNLLPSPKFVQDYIEQSLKY